MQTCGQVVALSTSVEKGVPKINVDTVQLVENWGIAGDAHAGAWHRQISLLAMESIETMRAKGADVHPGNFAENITTVGIDIPHLHVGDRLRVGASVLEVTQIGKECHAHCAIYQQVGDCIMPREGVFARVVAGGTVRVGDVVEIVASE